MWNKTGIWGDVFANQTNQGVIDEQEGYKSEVGGFVFGTDHLLVGKGKKGINSTLGATFAYSKVNCTLFLNNHYLH